MALPYSPNLEILAYEAFIRRAAELDLPFMLKGSYVTRQYFENPADRIPYDLDWVYMERVENADEAQTLFNDWATRATELWQNDGVVFRSFRENAFWRMIEYAMADDFPTVNTDLLCWVNKEKFEDFSMDVSFNLPMDVPSVPLFYNPLQGEPFIILNTTPLSLQVAWKLHQSLTRLRFKDLFDLLHLLKHPDFDEAARRQTMYALKKECRADNTDITRLQWLVAGNLQPLHPDPTADAGWQYWRHGRKQNDSYYFDYAERAEHITNPNALPETLADFQQQIREAFSKAGFNASAEITPAADEDQSNPSLRKPGFIETIFNFFR